MPNGLTVPDDPDIVIVGPGMGGATLAAAYAPTGARIVMPERGEHLQDSPDCSSGDAILTRGVSRPDEHGLTPDGQPFSPGNFYYADGNTRFYKAVMLRFRKADFDRIDRPGGVHPAWLIAYVDPEPRQPVRPETRQPGKAI